MRFSMLLCLVSLIAAGAEAQTVETSLPTPILGNGQADAARNMNDADAMQEPLNDGLTPQQKRALVDQAIREAVARDYVAKQAQAEAAKKAGGKGAKATVTKKQGEQNQAGQNQPGQGQAAPLTAPSEAASPALVLPPRRSPSANAEDQILQQMH